MQIINVSELTKHTEDFISNHFKRYAEEKKVKHCYKRDAFVAYENDEIVGVVTLQLVYNEVYVDELIIAPDYRKQGVGTKLLQIVENHYKDSDFEILTLSTYNFQAPDFYKKLGFTLEFVRENKNNPQLTRYFFVKFLK